MYDTFNTNGMLLSRGPVVEDTEFFARFDSKVVNIFPAKRLLEYRKDKVFRKLVDVNLFHMLVDKPEGTSIHIGIHFLFRW